MMRVVDGDGTGLVGRGPELATLDAARQRATGGEPTVVLIVGEAGMGKTELVRYVVATPDIIGVTAAGDQVEMELDYGVVDQLLRDSPLAGDTVSDALPAVGTDPLEAGAALLRLVDGLEFGSTLVVTIDDAHWADRASLDAMTFAARRLRADRVLLCVATRPEGLDRLPHGLLRLADATGGCIELAGLDAPSIRILAQALRDEPVSLQAAERLRAHTAGNPLHARALLRELPAGVLAGGGPLPAPRSYATLVLARLASCHQPARELVSALAVIGQRAALATVATAAGLDDPLPALDEAIERRLVDLVESPGERAVTFAHPLVRAAVLDDLPPSRRAAIHRAAAAALPGTGGLRHRLAGCAGYDAELAQEALATAAVEVTRGAYASAARLSLEAARVAADQAARDEAMLDALDQLLLAGNVVEVRERRAQVDSAAPGAKRSFVQGRLAYVLGPRRDATRFLEEAWAEVTGPGGEPTDQTLAGRIAALLATCAVDRADGENGLRWARRALGLARVTAADCNHGHMLAMASALQGRLAEGMTELSDALADPPAHPAAVADLHLGRGVLRLWVHELRGAADDLRACLGAWGSGGTLVSRETARFFLADLQYRSGAWEDSLVTAEVAASVVDESDQAWLAAFSHAIAAQPLAARGDFARAEDHLAAAQAAADAVSGGAAGLWTAVARLQLAHAREDTATILAIGDAMGGPGVRSVDEGIAPWRAGYVEALVDGDRVEDARGVAQRLAESTGAAPPSPLVRAEVARAQVAVAGAEEDRAAIEAATATVLAEPAQAPGPFARGRLELAAGIAWRRAGDRRRSAELVEAARGRFAELRATPWLERVDRELLATGLRSAARATSAGAALTAQEQAVCHLVVQGKTNRETAAELYLSVKTVEHHLSRAYAKLGVRSRTALAHVLATGEAGVAGAGAGAGAGAAAGPSGDPSPGR
jgi:DNA-binding CsgD family transcriptional regulator